MKWICLVLVLHTGAAMALNQISTRVNGIAYAEPIAFKEFVDGWNPLTFSGGERALAHWRLEVDHRFGGWGWRIFYADTADSRFSPDTAEFYMLVKNRRLLNPEKTYRIELEYNRARYAGVRLQRVHRKDWYRWRFGTSLLFGESLTSGRIRGNIKPVTDKDYDFGNLDLRYHYSKDELFDRPVDSPFGLGLALDIAFSARWQDRASIVIGVENMPGGLYWFDAPMTKAVVNTDNKEIDPQGFVKVSPILSGEHGREDFYQTLDPVARLYADLQLIGAIYQVNKGFGNPTAGFLQSGLGFKTASSQVNILYEINTGAWGFEWGHRVFQLGVASDAEDPDRAKYFRLYLSWVLTL